MKDNYHMRTIVRRAGGQPRYTFTYQTSPLTKLQPTPLYVSPKQNPRVGVFYL